MPDQGLPIPNPGWERGQCGKRHRLSSCAQSARNASFKRPLCTELVPRRKTQHHISVSLVSELWTPSPEGISPHLISNVFRKNIFMTNIASTSLGKSCVFMTRISFSFSSARLGFGQWSCMMSFGELVMCLLYLQLLVGWFCTLTLTGYNSLDVLIFLSPVKT